MAPQQLQIDGFQSFSSILKLSEIGTFIYHYIWFCQVLCKMCAFQSTFINSGGKISTFLLIFTYRIPNYPKYWLLHLKLDGFKNHSLKIDGFGRTHRTHAPGATVNIFWNFSAILDKYKIQWTLLFSRKSCQFYHS